MHEYSIVQALLTQCEEHVQENDAQKVTKLVVKIGVMSGVEPHLLETAFNTFKETTVCDGAEFIIRIQPLAIKCNVCDTFSELENRHYCCPHCESVDVEVVDGEDMYLMQLELQ